MGIDVAKEQATLAQCRGEGAGAVGNMNIAPSADPYKIEQRRRETAIVNACMARNVTFKRSSEQRKIMSRLTKPSVIFRERVVPAYADYLNHPLSEYHANNLAQALNNKVEWTYLYLYEVENRARLNGATLASFRTGLLTEHRALHVMSDLADAAQHPELTFERKPARVVTLSTDAYYEKEGVLFVKHFDTPFPSAAKQAFEFWRDWPD
jgi:hypothetical protein